MCTFEKNKVCLFMRPARYVMCVDLSYPLEEERLN